MNNLGLILMTLFLLGMCAEVFRESHFVSAAKNWTVHHYPRMTVNLKELPWWAERKSPGEVREHRRRWHIDLLGRTKIKELKK